MTHRPPRYRIALVREESAPAFPAKQFRVAEDVVAAFGFLHDADREEFWVAALDQRHRVIATHLVSVGSLTESLVHPREVIKPLLLSNAAAVIFVHNHPSGDPTPSDADHALTRRLVDACALMGIRVLDHIIIGETHHYSFQTSGQLPEPH